jgi:tRNA A-37 threonylcarbamoyl transferase component Bud32/predicted ATPase
VNSANPTNTAKEEAPPLTKERAGRCPVCCSMLAVAGFREFCPVCVLRGSLAGSIQSGSRRTVAGASSSVRLGRRFGNYELLEGEDGKPLELGRGAMGITFKAFDVALKCPVTLKVISRRYLGDESARRRFLHEARAAASLHHANVASVFHLGRSGRDYFYAMEFVEGETLEKLIKRRGRLEVSLALEITGQVAAGLAAVHKQKLVHRDIKPTNIMVSLEEEGTVTTKIIDLGLAKTVQELGCQTTISALGGFAGTPAFASPEQFAGVALDIRSDLYSLGVTLWKMLAGKEPFSGTPPEVLYQHQHAPLPLAQLIGIPQPVVVLLEVLLEKDPKRRLQSPSELLNAISAIMGAIYTGSRIIRQSLQRKGVGDSHARTPAVRLGPEKISIARLPVTGINFFGREADVAFLDEAWENPQVNVVTIVAWAGVGKSTLVNQWLLRMAAEHYSSAELVFGWSFYRQGTSGWGASADEFLDAALRWFGDSDPRIGTAWGKGERLAQLVAHRRTLLVLDGLEPLQNPPGPQEGRLREPSLQALLRRLVAFNRGLCVITTRMPVADIIDHESHSVVRWELDQLSSDAGAQLLRALSVIGDEEKLRSASDEFGGHCLALTLLGSYLADAHNGNIRCREEVRFGRDQRQGFHARRVMESYQSWLGEGAELSVLRMLGLFDRPADERAFGALLKPPAIPGLTESLTDLSPSERRAIIDRLRRARLLSEEDLHNPGHLDAHPLIREYFGEQLRSQQTDAWKECNRRLYNYYRALAPQLPENVGEMEPLFLAVVCGCNAGLYREALNEVYVPRIQRGDACFASNVLGAKGALLSVLHRFFDDGRWGSPALTVLEEQSLTAEDQLLILMQAGSCLTATRGHGSSEARICYERAEPLCCSLRRPLLLCVAIIGRWRYSLHTDKLTATMQIAEQVHSLAQKENSAVLMIEAYRALAVTHQYLGHFEAVRRYAMRAVQIWRSGNLQSHMEDPNPPIVVCLCYLAESEWYLGEIDSYKSTIAEAISIAKELKDRNALAQALNFATLFAQLEGNVAEADRLAADLTELSTRDSLAYWLAPGAIFRGWARTMSGETAEGIASMEQGIRDYRAIGSVLAVPQYLALKAEALHLGNRTPEALEAIGEAEALAEKFEQHAYRAELYRLRGVFLAAIGADESRIEASFQAAIRTAEQQKSISLVKRAEASYTEYLAQRKE